MYYRLLRPKPLLFHSKSQKRTISDTVSGFQRSIQWRVYCSNAGTEKVEVRQGKGGVVEETDVKKIVDMHPGVFPKVTQDKKKVVGYGYTLKGFFANLKERFLGNPQLNDVSDATTTDATLKCDGPPNTIFQPGSIFQSSEAVTNSDSAKESVSKSATIHATEENSAVYEVDTKVSEVLKKHPDNNELCSPECLLESSETTMNSLGNEKNASTSVPCHILRENASEDTAASEFSNTLDNPDHTRLTDIMSVFQPSEAIVDPRSNEKNISANVASHVMGDNSFEQMDQWGEISDYTKPENQLKKLDAKNSGILGDLDKNEILESGKLSSSTRLLLRKDSTKSENDDPISAGNWNSKSGKKFVSYDQTRDGSEVGENPAPPDVPQEFKVLAGLVKRTENSQTVEAMAKNKTSNLPPNENSKFSNGTLNEDIEKQFHIKGLIECISEMGIEKTFFKSDALALENNKLCKSKEQQSTKLSIARHTKSLNRDKDAGKLKLANNDQMKLEGCQKVPISKNKKEVDKTLSTYFTKEASSKNQVVVRFLPKDIIKEDIDVTFSNCSPIVKIHEIPSIKGSSFKDIVIHFETREGMQKGLAKTDVTIRNADVIQESTSSVDMPNRILIPNLIGDHDVPTLLVKNPNQTVMMKTFGHSVCSDQLKEALELDGFRIASLLIDSSTSIAYIEFETEDDKERAIEKCFIHVLGKKRHVLRIDAPRTTVVRISNINPTAPRKSIQSTCLLHGKVRKTYARCDSVADVHFKLAEWPNMLNILNSLNGKHIDGHNWIVQPAPIFPPDVLQVLWSHPDGRRHVKATFNKLLKKIVDPIDTSDCSNTAIKYFKDEF